MPKYETGHCYLNFARNLPFVSVDSLIFITELMGFCVYWMLTRHTGELKLLYGLLVGIHSLYFSPADIKLDPKMWFKLFFLADSCCLDVTIKESD